LPAAGGAARVPRPTAPTAGDMRLQKYLSRAGVASRRAAESMILAGRVSVNGRVVTELGTRVDPSTDRVAVDGEPVALVEPVWIALHKPPGHVTTRSDPQGRPTIYDLIPESYAGLFHVGRLDVDSEGLLLLTNQGDVSHRLLHPRRGVDRVYEVLVRGAVTDEGIRRLLEGVELEDGVARAVTVRRLPGAGPGRTRLRVTLREGRKREVRRLFAVIGHPVRRLVRVRFGPIRLGRLERGRWRRLSAAEIAALRRAAGYGDRARGVARRRGTEVRKGGRRSRG